MRITALILVTLAAAAILTPAALAEQPAANGPVGDISARIANAKTVDEARQAFAAGSADDLALNRAFLIRALELGQPEQAYAQAKRIEQKDPTDGLALTVISINVAQAGNMPEGLAGIILAAQVQPKDPYILRVAGQLMAWTEQPGNAQKLSADLQAAVKDFAKQAGQDKEYLAGFEEAAKAYRELTAAANQPREQQPAGIGVANDSGQPEWLAGGPQAQTQSPIGLSPQTVASQPGVIPVTQDRPSPATTMLTPDAPPDARGGYVMADDAAPAEPSAAPRVANIYNTYNTYGGYAAAPAYQANPYAYAPAAYDPGYYDYGYYDYGAPYYTYASPSYYSTCWPSYSAGYGYFHRPPIMVIHDPRRPRFGFGLSFLFGDRHDRHDRQHVIGDARPRWRPEEVVFVGRIERDGARLGHANGRSVVIDSARRPRIEAPRTATALRTASPRLTSFNAMRTQPLRPVIARPAPLAVRADEPRRIQRDDLQRPTVTLDRLTQRPTPVVVPNRLAQRDTVRSDGPRVLSLPKSPVVTTREPVPGLLVIRPTTVQPPVAARPAERTRTEEPRWFRPDVRASTTGREREMVISPAAPKVEYRTVVTAPQPVARPPLAQSPRTVEPRSIERLNRQPARVEALPTRTFDTPRMIELPRREPQRVETPRTIEQPRTIELPRREAPRMAAPPAAAPRVIETPRREAPRAVEMPRGEPSRIESPAPRVAPSNIPSDRSFVNRPSVDRSSARSFPDRSSSGRSGQSDRGRSR